MSEISLKERAAQLKGAVDDLAQQIDNSFESDTTRQYLLKITSEMTAIICNLEEGAEKILDHTEELFQYAKELKDDEQERISFHTTSLCEAACFHELSCQRISKVIDMLNDFFEAASRVGGAQTPDIQSSLAELEKKNNQKLAGGPQLPTEGVSQNAVDDFF